MYYSYESHKLGNKEIPFTLHSDTVVEGIGNAFNWHRETEFLYVLEGSGTFVSDASSFEVSVGDVFAINANSIHTCRSETGIRYHCLIVDYDFCIENGINTDEIVFENKISDTVASSLFESIIKEFKNKDKYSNAAIRSSVLAFLVYLARNYTLDPSERKNYIGKKTIENMRAAVDYIRHHFTEKLSLDDIADYVGVSKCHFAREFKKLMGITPIGYINMLRCETAAKMLSGGKYTVGEIQLSCGFENASYFTKVFKEYMGETPVSVLNRK